MVYATKGNRLHRVYWLVAHPHTPTRSPSVLWVCCWCGCVWVWICGCPCQCEYLCVFVCLWVRAFKDNCWCKRWCTGRKKQLIAKIICMDIFKAIAAFCGRFIAFRNCSSIQYSCICLYLYVCICLATPKSSVSVKLLWSSVTVM